MFHLLLPWENQITSVFTFYSVLGRSVVSDSLLPHGLQPTRLLCLYGFSRQEYWSGLPCLSPGDLPNTGIEPRSPTLQVDYLPSEPPGKPTLTSLSSKFNGFTNPTDTISTCSWVCRFLATTSLLASSRTLVRPSPPGSLLRLSLHQCFLIS